MTQATMRWFSCALTAFIGAFPLIANATPEDDKAEDVAEDASALSAQFSPSVFSFVTIIRDDGSGAAGGWQEASTQLKFVDARHTPQAWICPLKVGMPIRTAASGVMSPTVAAAIAATLASQASRTVMHRQPSWLSAAYCIAFRAEMQRLFLTRYPLLGARVSAG